MISRRIVRLGLTALGVAGIPVTSWLSIRAHEKAKDAKTRKDKLVCYIPPILSGTVAAGCIIARDVDASKEIAALTATATYAVANRDKLEAKVNKLVHGEEKVDTIKRETLASKEPVFAKPPVELMEISGNETMPFIEHYTGRQFYSTYLKVLKAEDKLSNLFNDGEYISYNDFYSLLGLSKTGFGENHGWVPKEDYYNYRAPNPLGFYHSFVTDDNGVTTCCIDILEQPLVDYLDL